MRTSRLEAFSDGVLAIIITIMVLELRVPHGAEWDALRPLVPVFLTYILSFIHIGIYWNNHHHMMAVTGRVNGRILWANLHLLFWLSLVPVTTGWMGENDFAKKPTAAYGIVLLFAAIAYYILQSTIVAEQGKASTIATALGRDVKGKLSPVLYTAGIATSFLNRWVGLGFYVAVALMWLIPDRRLESLGASE
jgi:uncharacterized membrane protein